jgi:hypothetical protein
MEPGLLPMLVLFLMVLTLPFGRSAVTVVRAVRQATRIPGSALATFIAGLGLLAFLWFVGVALMVGLAHSREPFQYTRLHAAVGVLVLFILPSVALLEYQRRANRREQRPKRPVGTES